MASRRLASSAWPFRLPTIAAPLLLPAALPVCEILRMYISTWRRSPGVNGFGIGSVTGGCSVVVVAVCVGVSGAAVVVVGGVLVGAVVVGVVVVAGLVVLAPPGVPPGVGTPNVWGIGTPLRKELICISSSALFKCKPVSSKYRCPAISRIVSSDSFGYIIFKAR